MRAARMAFGISNVGEDYVRTYERGKQRWIFAGLLTFSSLMLQGGWFDPRFDLPGANGLDAPATCVAVAGTNVFAAGTFQHAGEVAANHIARWDGGHWYPLGSGIGGTVVQMASRGEELFVIGAFTSAGDMPATNVAKWNGAVWSGLGGGLSGPAMAVATSAHYVWVARTVETNFVISRWDGTSWADVARGNFGYGSISTILALDDSILVGGSFWGIDGTEVNNVARWDGTRWNSLGGGLSGEREYIPNDYPFTTVRALLQEGTNLYAAGSFTNAGGIKAMNVACWDGSRWSALGQGIPGFASCITVIGPGVCVYPVTSLAVVGGELFAGGGFTVGDGTSRGYLAKWDGTTWTNVVEGVWTIDTGAPGLAWWDPLHVWALASCQNDLYVAGNFGTIAGLPSYGFALWHQGNPPALRLGLKDGGLVLSWPRQFQYATVEFAGSLASPLWRPVADIKVESSNTSTNDVEAAITPPGLQAFYRLRLQ